MMNAMTESGSPHGSSAATRAPAGRPRRRWVSPVVGIGVSAASAQPRLRFALRLGELAAGLVFVLVTLPGSSVKHTPGLIAAAVGAAAWLAWILCAGERRRSLAAVLVLSAASGVSAAAHSTGGLLCFVATAAASFAFGVPAAVGSSIPAIVALLLTNLTAGTFPGHVPTLVAAGLLGVVLGAARQQLLQRGRESALLATAQRRVALADREAQLVSERNRLGRELHDVLAHTLGAASIQLTALDSRLAAGDSTEQLRERVRGLHGLVGDGLREARDAVHALRDDRLSLETQIERLCTLHGARLTVKGRSQALRADEALALYRVVQEALTNTAKHALGATGTVTLGYTEIAVSTVIENGPPATRESPLADSGGGQGLEGMRARVELVGGHCTAGPHGDGWRVAATIPLR